MFARAWLGRDVETGAVTAQAAVDGLDWQRQQAITAEACRYGIHATLKAPFSLAEGRTEAELLAEASRFAEAHRPVPLGELTLKPIAGFLALTAEEAARPLSALAAACVRDFDHFRAAPSPEELRRRRAAPLTPRQDDLLTHWGYPYVFDEFRFHITLTSSLKEPERKAVEVILRPLTEPWTGVVEGVRDLVVFIEDALGAPFRVLARFPLATS